MEKTNLVKEEILSVVAEFLGDPTAQTFADFYRDETLPIYTEGALKILEGIIGEEKASEQIENAYKKHQMEKNHV